MTPPFPPDARRAARALLIAAACAWTLQGCSRHASETVAPPVDVAPPKDVPADYVGVWTSTRGTVMRCIELRADGVYQMAPNTDAGDRVAYHGTWRIAGEEITWRDASDGYAPDVNRMIDVSDGHFTTIESDQSQTRFDRIAGAGATCPS